MINDILTSQEVSHPLAPLSAFEIGKVVDVIKYNKNFTPTFRFISIVLKEPSKSVVKSFKSGDEITREAFIVLFDNANNACYEVIVNINNAFVSSWEHIPGVQPTMSADEQIECEKAVMESQLFKEALAKYGITDMNLLMVDIWSAGNYGQKEESTMRLARPLCFLRSEPGDNGYARPIEGLKPVVDLNTMQVIRVEDYGKWPMPTQSGNYALPFVGKFRKDIKPIEITQPEGPSFTVKGHEISWQKWNFVIGFNSREGLTIHHLNYDDEGKKRSILYRASLSEMVVPYGDPTDTQKRKNAFDSGEYGMGMCANSLELGCDCVGYIQYFDAHLTNSRGEPFTIKNAICMHEEDYGILWKHTDRRIGVPEVRRSRRLVISSVSTVENYEYGFFWYLYQDGNIQFEIKLTGILSLGAYHPGQTPKYGNLIAPQLYAPNHQHFFNIRLDFDIDGENNTVYQVDIVPDEIDENNPFENAFYAKATPLETESKALGKLNLETGRYWKIVNENVKNHVGDAVGYKFIAGDNCVPFASKNSSWRKRAGFVENHVWVTPLDEKELFAAGDYPNQHIGGDGLIKWIQKDREIRNKDIVFWYTMGHNHIPRPEDYPVMPTAYIGFLLKPLGFFSQNPANDVPPSNKIHKSENSACCN
ncbi:MAG: primary-amine oxidase [Cytophagales bacterium]|nr:primary-amine oxidase [Cytophagales bacterium]